MKNKITTDKDNIAKFKKTGELYGKKIECNSCSTLITCFGSNLEGKIAKFGSIESLLETFTCRSCVSASKVKVVKKISLRKKKEVKVEKIEIPKMKFTAPRNVLLKDAPDIIESYTSFSCAAPTLYLDNGRACHGCAFFNSCKCELKGKNDFAAV
jgi:hypothetical protein